MIGCNIESCGTCAFYVATQGDPLAIIDARYNWWGAADSLGIEQVVIHKADTAALPTVDFVPFLPSPLDPAVDGACCLADGSCLVLEESICTLLAGDHHGETSRCYGDSNGDGVDDLCGAGCCVGRTGDANSSGDDEPTIGDVAVLIDAKFVSATCTGLLDCLTEADVNQSGGADPTCADITIGDISALIDYLFITGSSLGLPDCL